MAEKNIAKNVTYKQVLDKIREVFMFDEDKALSFYMSQNTSLDNLSPYEMVKQGKGRKLMQLLEKLL